MKLLGFLLKTKAHQNLARLLWVEGLTASLHELSQMSGLPYATAYDLLHKMEKMDLVKMRRQGKALFFSSNLTNDRLCPYPCLLFPFLC